MSDNPQKSIQNNQESVPTEQTADSLSNGPWETPIIRNDENKIIGVLFFIGKNDLKASGLNIESNQVLHYRVHYEQGIQFAADPENL
jgi:hypothetical protein